MSDFLAGFLADHFPDNPHSPAFIALIVAVALLELGAIGGALHLGSRRRRTRPRPEPVTPAGDDQGDIVLPAVTIGPRRRELGG
jgi:hypothetical protein